jgi:hypothetical protein
VTRLFLITTPLVVTSILLAGCAGSSQTAKPNASSGSSGAIPISTKHTELGTVLAAGPKQKINNS